ncbi:pilus assembly PilX N-terminal domain-containing protein [Thalassotalea euphylliae]|uniref:Type 4 fimbrial biogenesis protein PilX N-terminal domain-containing protein n=1 Tax=Thalassotalea euphylliae TaxID=1655234 RepID=A0A3E0UDX6_9GAMM|nr:pilus assembly PilX N-terminal domain-containing protein [Thalassotalea euphylliae]REL34767.1 hypothetical protein DXX92_05025 [Thalassotalea euphylliae]
MVGNQKKTQTGFVLITSIVFLVALTAVASVLMLNSSSDIKMSGASEEKLIAVQAAVSALDETVADQIRGNVNLFAGKDFPQPVNTITSVAVSSVVIDNELDSNEPTDCPHTTLSSSNQLLKCNVVSIAVTNQYGRNNTSEVRANANIAQQLLNVGN